jgi:hypothetical protein
MARAAMPTVRGESLGFDSGMAGSSKVSCMRVSL